MARRQQIDPELVAELFYLSADTCCVCTVPGKALQVHHIDKEASNNSPSNLAVLCLEDHNRAHLSGGFARQLSAAAIKMNRDEWVVRVARRRERADDIVSSRMSMIELPQDNPCNDKEEWVPPPEHTLVAYIDHLPAALNGAHLAEQEEMDSGVTSNMVQATGRICDVVEQMWIYLSRWYPPHHFGADASAYISQYRSDRTSFHWARYSVGGKNPGTMYRPTVTFCVLRDLESLVEETVDGLMQLNDHRVKDWATRWRTASTTGTEAPDGPLMRIIRYFRMKGGPV